jgi:polyhydroxybutyrate depolymerase
MMIAADRTRTFGPLVAAVVIAAVLLSAGGMAAGDSPGGDDAPAGDPERRHRVEAPLPALDDVPPGHPFYDEITWLVVEGISDPEGGSFFRPTRPLTRQAAAAFLHRYALTAEVAAAGPGCAAAPFPDVPVSHPFCAAIAWLADHAIAGGYADGTFRPSSPVSRQAMVAFLQRLEENASGEEPPEPCPGTPFNDVADTSPFCGVIHWAANHEIAGGYPGALFHPTAIVTRQAAAAFLHRFDGHYGDAPVPSVGCGTSTQGPVVAESRTLTVGATERSYLLTVPTAHDGTTPRPLVVDFHGFGEGAQVHTLMSELSPVAEAEGFVAVFPHGTGTPVRWNTNPDLAANPDLQFVDALLDQLATDLCVDRAEVYAMGLSNGAFMTSVVGCTLSDRFAAIAPVAGAIRPSPCAATRPVPMLAFHGTQDPILRFNGGVGPIGGPTTTSPTPPDLDGPGFPANVAAWADANGCEPTATDTPITDEVLHRVYSCPDDADVEFLIILGGGHTWPGSAFSASIASIVGHTTMDIHASEESWDFFTRFQLPRWGVD